MGWGASLHRPARSQSSFGGNSVKGQQPSIYLGNFLYQQVNKAELIKWVPPMIAFA